MGRVSKEREDQQKMAIRVYAQVSKGVTEAEAAALIDMIKETETVEEQEAIIENFNYSVE
jgi:hypothetical protein